MLSSIICQGKRSGDEVFSDSLPEAFPKFPVHSMVDFNMLEFLREQSSISLFISNLGFYVRLATKFLPFFKYIVF